MTNFENFVEHKNVSVHYSKMWLPEVVGDRAPKRSLRISASISTVVRGGKKTG